MKITFSKGRKVKEIYLFPPYGLVYLSLFVLIVVAAIFLLDRVLIPKTIFSGKIGGSASEEWKVEDDLIFRNNRAKIKNFCPWETASHGVLKKSKLIVVLGDSFVWGEGHANMNDIWWRQLQRVLVNRGYRDIEVVACGKNGWSTNNQLEAAKNIVPIYKPDLVIWSYTTNDPEEKRFNGERIVKRVKDVEAWNAYHRDLTESDTFMTLFNRSRSLVPHLAGLFSDVRYKKLLSVSPPPHEIGYPYDEWELQLLEGENFKQYKATLQEVAQFFSEHSPQFFVTLPNYPDRRHFSRRYRPVLRKMDKLDIPYYDLLPSFVQKYGEDKRPILQWGVNPVNAHPHKVTTHFYAEEVATIIEENYPSALPEKKVYHAPPVPYVNDWLPIEMKLKNSNGTVHFLYPESTVNLLKMPFGYKYVQLNLAVPLKMRSIQLSGTDLVSAALSVTYEDFDDLSIDPLEKKEGTIIRWTDKEFQKKLPVDTVRIAAALSPGGDRLLQLDFETIE
jgi:lysophospholipase L1-like esterase